MPKIQKFTAIIEREDDGYVSLCPELDIASQGLTQAEAKENLVEAIELFLEVADPTEVTRRLQKGTLVMQLEVTVG
jgi:predicted RNase H-like HicB family nuclease